MVAKGPARPAVLERELANWELANGLRLRVLLVQHKGRRYVDARRWFRAVPLLVANPAEGPAPASPHPPG